jgi:hypothetical protein
MEEIVPIVLGSWVVLTIVLFKKRPAREAALIAMVGGWAILPTGIYAPSVFAAPIGSAGSIHALAVPTALLCNKALAIGLGCLLGVILFDWPAVERLRPVWLDAPMVAWCLVPVAAVLANGAPLAAGLAQTRYLALAWGVPYLMGRLTMGDDDSLGQFGQALVLAGLIYVPFGVLEFVLSPFLYGLTYGPHPYQLEGAVRLVGYRPLIFLEHGNQLGIWIACAAVGAVWLWCSGRLTTIAGIPGGFAAAVLVAACLLFQSQGALLLLLAGLALLRLLPTRRSFYVPRRVYVGLAAGILLLALAVASAVVAAERANWGALRVKVREVFHSIGKSSFTWRLARSEEDLDRVAERPLLGWGRPDWSAAPDGKFVNPVNLGLWLTTLGSYGIIGLTCMTAVLLLPVAQVLRKLPLSQWTSGSRSAIALTALLLVIAAIDSLLNSVLLLPLLAGAGGIHTWSAGTDRRRGWEYRR